jgi:hypothetical protein
MRRWILLALISASSVLGAVAGCSSFTSDGSDAADGGDGAADSAQEADVATQPSSCPLAPTAPPCTTGCTAKLPLLPSSVAKPGIVGDARIAVKDGTLYVARVVDGVRVELLAYDGTSPSWALLGSYPGNAVYGLAVNDTSVLVSLRHPAPPSPPTADAGADGGADGGAATHVIVAVQASCRDSCTGTPTTVQGSSSAGTGVVALGPNFYFSAEKAVMVLKNGQVTTVATTFGAPVVTADCAYVYWSNAFDDAVHRVDDATGIAVTVGTGTRALDGGYDGPYPGTVSLATTDESVVGSTGSGHIYTMPKSPTTQGPTVIVDQPSVGQVVADSRFVYYAKPAGLFVYDVVRVLPDGGAPTTLTVGALQIVGMATDADHVYVVEASGDVTRIAK